MLNLDTARQQGPGFGVAFTDASCCAIRQLPEKQTWIIHELRSLGKMAENVCSTRTEPCLSPKQTPLSWVWPAPPFTPSDA